MKIRKDDTVLIISGKDRGRKGKIIESFPKKGRVVVEGINLRKKHAKPKKSGEKGQIVETPAFIDVSNIKLICSKCGKPTRTGYKKSKIKREPTARLRQQKSKIRICKKCGQEI